MKNDAIEEAHPEMAENGRLAKLLQVLTDVDYMEATKAEISQATGIPPRTLYRYWNKLDWPTILGERRKKYARFTCEADSALRQAFKDKNVRAIELWYERFDGWVPASKVLTEHSLEENLIDDELKYLSDRRIATASALASSGGVDGKGRGEVSDPPAGEGPEKA